MAISKSEKLFERAQHSITGGVNSSVRAFKGVGGYPPFIKRGEGATLIDEDDIRYIDYVGSWGPLILGHCHPAVLNAIEKILHDGLSFGAPTEREILIAETICKLMPSIELVRMVSSGTEATMTAIRLARGYTKRNKIVKFEGCYHGHSDSLLVKYGSGGLTFGIPDSAGVPPEFAKHTLVAPYNDIDAVKKIFDECGNDIAAIIIEPVACNMNCVLPISGFLQTLRQLCDQHQSLLIFDEVITGFRVGIGGAQQHYQVKPDLTTLGKIIGGGMPAAALGGKREIMSQLAPLGAVYQAGTLSGNPIAMAAGLATLQQLAEHPEYYQQLEKTTAQLTQGLKEIANAAGIPVCIQSIASLFGLFFTEKNEIRHCDEVRQCNIERFKQFFHGMLKEGIYLAPSAFEAGFVSIKHGPSEIDRTLEAARRVFKNLS